ncbi:hypothetical protein ABPG72_021409 [Tetrahymena utriculariae]
MDVSVQPWVTNKKDLFPEFNGFGSDDSVDYSEQNKQPLKNQNLFNKDLDQISKEEDDNVKTLGQDTEKSISQVSSSLSQNQKKKKKVVIKVNTSKSRSELKLLRILIDKNGWKETFGYEGNILWSGLSMNGEQLAYNEICVNRYPQMEQLAHKKTTGYFLNLFREYFPEHFDFFPKTYLIPEQIDELKAAYKKNSKKLCISKPSSGCQGDGIKLIEAIKDLPISSYTPYANQLVVQEYISNPMLIYGKKFDLRLYVLISSLDPLIVYLHDEGLARFCTEPYEKPSKTNINNSYMHLTNYSLNKNNPTFKLPTEEDLYKDNDASKRTMQVAWQQIVKAGYDKEEIMENIEDLICKFLASMHPYLIYNYQCVFDKKQAKRFHVLGFDILLDDKGKPWFLEVNANPSFNIEHEVYQPDGKKKVEQSPLDKYVKCRVVEDAIFIVNKKIEKQLEIGRGNHFRGFKQLISGNFEEYKIMDIFSDILKIYGKLSGFKFNSALTSSKFSKLATYQGMQNDKVIKNDYDLIFKKILQNSQEQTMSFYDFIRSIEILAQRLNPQNFDPQNKLPAVSQLVNNLLKQL